MGRGNPDAAPAIERRSSLGNHEPALNFRMLSAKPAGDTMFKAHDANRAVIAGYRGSNCLGDPLRIAATALYFDQERDAAGNEFEQLGKPGNMLVAVEQPLTGEDFGPRGFYSQCRCAHAPEVMIVEYHDLVVTRQADVTFDARARFDGGAERGHAVFRNAGAVQPAMREPDRPGVERVRI